MEVNKQRIAELVTKMQSGDDSDFKELYELTSERAFFVALEFTKNNQDAEDILQESYVKALSKINELDKPESFSSWLNQIVANKCKDFLKKKKPMLFEAEENEVFEVLPDEDTSFSPEENLDQNELQTAVKEILDELSEEKRACVLMMYFEELSVGEIAQTLEIPEGTVKTRLFSARKDLKEKFAKRGITSAYSIAPIGVVIWALRKMSDAVSKTFIGSGASANVLAGITVAGAGTAASVAVAGTTAASTAAAAAAGTATATGAAATGAGIAAKIAALTVAQKVIAGVSVAAVVAGGTAGVVTVANNNGNKDDISTTAYTEEYTTAPSYETTIAVDALGTVEFSETTGVSDAEITGGSSTDSQSTANNATAGSIKTTAKSSSTTSKQTTTKTTTKVSTTRRTTTRRDYSLYMSTATSATTLVTTTVEETTTHPRSMTTTTEKQTTTEKKTTTEKQTTTTKPTTTEATTLADPLINITYNIAGLSGDHSYGSFTVSPGTVIDEQFIRDRLVADPELGFVEATVQSGDFTSSAESGETYNFYVVGIKG